jgi:uncharacterized membrane protein YfcA
MAETMFYILLPLTAFLYASVGHGGASGYLALMAGISFVQFARAGHFQWRLFFVFAVLSIPLSFLGGMMELDPQWYKFTLGVLLLFAIARMIGLFDKEKMSLNELNWPIGILVGGSIGFFSGLIGIGGGIILSPVILLLRWGSIKEAAAVSALFIWVNSLAGLAGQLRFGFELSPNIWLMAGLTLIGGFAGGTAGSFFVGKKQMKLILSVVLILASVKLIFT